MQFIILALGNRFKINPMFIKFNNSLSVKIEEEEGIYDPDNIKIKDLCH